MYLTENETPVVFPSSRLLLRIVGARALAPYIVSSAACVSTLMLLQAKDMVTMVNKFATMIEEKKGAVTEDEVRKKRGKRGGRGGGGYVMCF